MVSLEPVRTGRHGAVDVARESKRRLSLLMAAAMDPVLQAHFRTRCAEDPFFWFDNFAWTYNGKKSPQNVPFVPWDFQRDVIKAFLGIGKHGRDEQGLLWPLGIDKSRDLGLTWVLVGCAFQDWSFHPGADYGLMTRSGTDLDSKSRNSLFGKLDFLLKMSPSWLLPKYERRRMPAPVLFNEDTGAAIEGSRTVPDAFRGGRHRRTIVDEAASVPKLGSIMESLDDVTPAPVLVSTPKGRGNYFANVIHGEAGQILEWGQSGVGWCHLRMHHSQHPERDPHTPEGRLWVKRERARRTKEKWAQEQDCDYSASVPGRIFAEFDPNCHVFSPEEWDDPDVIAFISQLPVIEGWDFGEGNALTCVVWGAYSASEDTLYLLDYRVWKEVTFERVARDYADAGWRCKYNPNGRVPHRRLGDIAGKQRDSSQLSWLENLKRVGIPITGRLLRDGDGLRHRLRLKFGAEKIICSPLCQVKQPDWRHLPSLTESIDQYRRDMATGKPIKTGSGGQYSHLSDGVLHIGDEVWPMSTNEQIKQPDVPTWRRSIWK